MQDLSNDDMCPLMRQHWTQPSMLVAMGTADASNRRRHQSSSSIGQSFWCKCYVKLRRVQLLIELHLRAVGVTCHMGSHSVTCHPTQVNTPHLNASQTSRYSIYRPRRDGSLSWPRWPFKCRDGLPAHRWSPIQVLTQQGIAMSQTQNLLITRPIP